MLNNTNAEIEELDKEIVLLHEGNESLREKLIKAQAKAEFQDNAKKTQIFKEEIEQMDIELNNLKLNDALLKQRLMKRKTQKNVKQDINANLDSRQDEGCDLKPEIIDLEKESVGDCTENDCFCINITTKHKYTSSDNNTDNPEEELVNLRKRGINELFDDSDGCIMGSDTSKIYAII